VFIDAILPVMCPGSRCCGTVRDRSIRENPLLQRNADRDVVQGLRQDKGGSMAESERSSPD
jgi:hypothetical protein